MFSRTYAIVLTIAAVMKCRDEVTWTHDAFGYALRGPVRPPCLRAFGVQEISSAPELRCWLRSLLGFVFVELQHICGIIAGG